MQVTWKLPDGGEITADVAEGQSLMEAARDNDVPHVLGECGGCLSCATCHVIVAPEWRDRVGGPGDMEEAMLDITAAPSTTGSRLSCQIAARADLDGQVLEVPAS